MEYVKIQGGLIGASLNIATRHQEPTLVMTFMPMLKDTKGKLQTSVLGLDPAYLNVIEVPPAMTSTICQSMGIKTPPIKKRKTP